MPDDPFDDWEGESLEEFGARFNAQQNRLRREADAYFALHADIVNIEAAMRMWVQLGHAGANLMTQQWADKLRAVLQKYDDRLRLE